MSTPKNINTPKNIITTNIKDASEIEKSNKISSDIEKLMEDYEKDGVELLNDQLPKKIKKINKDMKISGQAYDPEEESLSESMITKKRHIIKTLIEPAYEKDIKDNLKWRYTWRKISGTVEGFGQIITALGTIISFAAGTFKMEWLSFVAGCCMVIAFLLAKFSKYSASESKERTTALNIVLKHIGMRSIPTITQDNTADVNYNMGKLTNFSANESSHGSSNV